MNLGKDIVVKLASSYGESYSPPPMRAVRGRSITYEALTLLINEAIKHVQDSQEPVATVGLWDTMHWNIPQIDVPIGTKLFTFPPNQAAKAIDAEKVAELENNWSICDEKLEDLISIKSRLEQENQRLTELLTEAKKSVGYDLYEAVREGIEVGEIDRLDRLHNDIEQALAPSKEVE